MANFTPEMIAKAKSTECAEELLNMAKAGGLELTPEDAKVYFEMLNPKTGELSDDELDAVSGGGCKSKKSGRTVVTNYCKCFTGCYESIYLNPEKEWLGYKRTDNLGLRDAWLSDGTGGRCGSCVHLEFEVATGVCGKS